MEEKMEKHNNIEQKELDKCRLALELYTLARREYSNDNRPLDDFDKVMIENNASLLVDDEGDGLRIGAPMSSNIKFRYGFPLGMRGEKMFFLDSNDVLDSDENFQKFQEIVAHKFKQSNLPFYSFSK